MTTADAIAVMDALMKGVHPISKEPLQKESVIHEPIVMHALLHAIEAMKSGAGIGGPETPVGGVSPQDALDPATKTTAELVMELVRRVLPRQSTPSSRPSPVSRHLRPVMEKIHPPRELADQERSGRTLAGARRVTPEAEASPDSCPKHCLNCESPLASWGEYIVEGKCVWCENSGRVW
jgi:hypothetical protein